MEEIPEYINMLSYLFVALYMLSVPLETTRGEIIKTLGHLNLMGRALLANFVFIPILGIIIARYFDLPPEIRTGSTSNPAFLNSPASKATQKGIL